MSRIDFKLNPLSFIFFAALLGMQAAIAGDTVSEMQKKLNQEVMSRPFGVESQANLNAELNAATERGKPTKIINQSPRYGYLGNYYQPYYGLGYGYGFGYYRPYYFNHYRPYYSGLYW